MKYCVQTIYLSKEEYFRETLNLENLAIVDWYCRLFRLHMSYFMMGRIKLSNFYCSFRQNISLFNSEVRASDVVDIAKKIGLHSYIDNFERAYSHILRSNDTTLPISVRYKLELARVLLLSPSLVMMDSMDSQIDELLHLEILGLIESSGSRIIYVTGRRKIAENAQYLIRLKSGEINCYGLSEEIFEKHSLDHCLR